MCSPIRGIVIQPSASPSDGIGGGGRNWDVVGFVVAGVWVVGVWVVGVCTVLGSVSVEDSYCCCALAKSPFS